MIRRCISVLIVLFLLAGAIPAYAGAQSPLGSWNLRSPSPTNQDLNSVAYGNGMYVAVGNGGTIVTSSDGASWVKRTSGTTSAYYGVTYASDLGLYVAVGTSGMIKTSSDGINWVQQVSNFNNTIYSVTYGAGKFVAVGALDKVLTSPDGVNWTSRSPGTSNVWYTTVAYGNGKFIAAGGGTVASSSDGVTWTSSTAAPVNTFLYGTAYGNGKYVAVGTGGTITTSSNGTSWTSTASVTGNVQYKGVIYANGQFTVVGYGGTVLTSTDGLSWNTAPSPGTNTYMLGIVYANGSYLAVGSTGLLLTSADGASWTNRTLGTTNQLSTVSYTNGKYVTAGLGGAMMTSNDGVSWNKVASGVTTNLTAVGYGQGKYVAVGSSGTIITSGDTANWTTVTTGISNTLNGIAFGNGKYVAVGADGTILASAGGVVWTSVTSGTTNSLKGIVFGRGQFVAVGETGTIMTSSDGAVWTKVTLSGTDSFNAIAYGNGMYVAVGGSGVVMTSPDGSVWTRATSGTPFTLTSVAYSSGLYVAVGAGAIVLTSTDGANWTSGDSGAGAYMTGVAGGSGVFVEVGSSGIVFVAETIVNAANNRVSASVNSVAVGNPLELVAEGDRQLAAGVEAGSGKYIPISWTSTENGLAGTFSLSEGSYKSNYTPLAVGNYTITATFNKQTWDGSSWVTDTAANDTKTTTVSVNVRVDAQAPVIGTQPAGQTVNVGGSASLSAAASVSDEGTLSYQWYSSTTNSNSGGTAINSATSATFAAPTVTDGTTYYYVVITNTNNHVTGTITASVTSSAAKVIVTRTSNDSIALIADRTAAPLTEGYAAGTQETISVQVTNTGTGQLTNLSAALSGPNTDDFVITQPTVPLYGRASAASFTVKVKDGLAAGTYTAKVTVSAAQMEDVTFIVTQVVTLPNVPANPMNLKASEGDRQITLNWNTVTGATYYNVYMSTVPNTFSGASVATVTYTAHNVLNLNNGTTYYFIVKADQSGGLIAESNQASASPATVPAAPTNVTATGGNGLATVAFTAPTDNGGSAITGYEVTSSSGNVVLTEANSPLTIIGLINGTSYTFTVKAINRKGSSAASAPSNAVIPRSQSNNSSSSGSGSNTPSPAAPTTSDTKQTGVDVLVNGKIENAGTASTTKRNDQTVVTISIDQKKLDDRLAQEGQHAVVTIPVNTGSDVIIGELNGQMIKNMENKQAVLEIKTDRATYTLPAQQINIDSIVNQFGKSIALQDIKIQIEIAIPPVAAMKVVEDAADKGSFTLVAPPIEFTVRAVYEGVTIEVSKFNAYVERTIAIPVGVDPTRITTGVVVEPDGKVRHVPTKIVVVDGNYYAKVNSLTNSIYSVVWHKVEFKDVASHWAKRAVNDMGSRMVVSGVSHDEYSPDRAITRAEFAAIIIRGLGLKPETNGSSFTDVRTTDWYSSVINTAYAYKLIDGFEDNTFRPDDRITREQAMVMIAKAMTMTNLKAKLKANATKDTLAAYKDMADASAWALSGIADNIQAGIVSGRSSIELAPKAFITRAEVAVIIQRLLQQSELI